MISLEGRRALVTGAAKGIGRGIAVSLAQAGAELFLHYHSDEAGIASLCDELRRTARGVHTFRADLGDEAELDALFAEIDRVWNGLDIAVNNAGWDPGYMPMTDIDAGMYHKLTDLNIKGTLFCCLREIDLMRRRPEGGNIINIGSVQQDTSVPGRTLYATSKGAIHAMTGQLALECGPMNIRVNNIAPGYIEVERLSRSPSFNRDAISADIPRGRVGRVDDIGDFAVFLASDAADFITGQTLVIDGGVSRKLARSCCTNEKKRI